MTGLKVSSLMAASAHTLYVVCFPSARRPWSQQMAQRYALRSLEEAEAYLLHPVLEPRLVKCTALVNAVDRRSANEIFGAPDDMKFLSSMTLCAQLRGAAREFRAALDIYFGGKLDATTFKLLRDEG